MHSSSLNMNPNLFVSVSVLLEYVRVSIQTTQMVYIIVWSGVNIPRKHTLEPFMHI